MYGKRACVAAIAAAAFWALPARADVFRYSERTADSKTECVAVLESGANPGETLITLTNGGKGERCEIVIDESGGARSFSFDRPSGSVTLTREGNLVRSGDGRTATIDDAPWFASMEYGIARMLASGKTRAEFWVVDPDTLKPFKMIAEARGIETIEVAGAKVRATAVRVTASGVPALFFSMRYWFRETDRAYLRFEGARGFGAPKTTVELETEER